MSDSGTRVGTDVKMTSYWLDTAVPSGDYRTTTIPKEVDVAVVGAGFTGLSTALHAARAGRSVAVLEANTVVWGASGRNGGMATTGLAIGFRQALRRYGEQRAIGYFTEYNRAIDLIEDIVRENGLDVDYARSGKMNLAWKESHFEGLTQTADALRRLVGQPVRIVDRESIRSEIGSDVYHGAMVDPLGAGVHVAKFGHELARLAVEAGATVHENAEVVDVTRIGDGTTHVLQTSRGTIRAGKVVIGTSGYTGRPFGWVQRRIVPVGSFIVVTEPLPQAVADELLPNRRMASDTKNFIYYFRITPDNRLLFGGRARFAQSDPSSDRKSGEILIRAMHHVFPQMREARIDYMWGGLVDISMDQMVHAGEHRGLFYSTSYSGHGVQMATYMGKVMADVVSGRPEANVWRDLRNPWIPGHYGAPWMLPLGGAWYGLQDKLS
ncbi:FAD-binding oxidoreductase [Microbacterium betulae]|uniref:FAD-binding oxidoreductase n=1 Tax=Microbacterium betulae TaxID=2981139 RepID=A0AA97FJT9_9MICO|nr:FAD-binding oxidoreductase [Microbacterium sp. AB]WOF23379.1 FAD-binding oxidoreductase [Microbacterium sp. AB]